MKIKNLYYSASAITMALILSITGFSTNVEASSQREPKTSTNSESTGRTLTISNPEKGTQENQGIFKAGEIEVVNVYDPTTEKKETYFFTLENTLETKEEDAIKCAQILFKDTLLKRYLISDKSTVTKKYSRYKSIFNEECYCNIDLLSVTYQDGDYILTGMDEDIFLSNENEVKYSSVTKTVADAEMVYESWETAFCRDINKEVHTGDEQFKINMNNLTTYGYRNDEDISLDTLEEIKNDINEKSNAKNPEKAK